MIKLIIFFGATQAFSSFLFPFFKWGFHLLNCYNSQCSLERNLTTQSLCKYIPDQAQCKQATQNLNF